MAYGDSFLVELRNPNPEANDGGGQTGEAAVIFLITERDDKRNALELLYTNNTGDSVTIHYAIAVYMDQILPEDVIRKLEVTCPSGWRPQVFSGGGLTDGVGGISFIPPASGATLANNETLTFKFTNIVFASPDLEKIEPRLRYFVITAGGDLESDSTYGKFRAVLLKPVTDQPCPLTLFEAAFMAVPEGEGWNARMGGEEKRIQKRSNTVYSNPLSEATLTRLAFSLINQDEMDDLKLTTGSAFKILFLPGEGPRELESGDHLVRYLSVKELFTQDWTIAQATSIFCPEWVLTPRRDLTLKSGGGSYTFLIDFVWTNEQPRDNAGPRAFTPMYVYYSKVPRRDGPGLYDDGYLTAMIEKVAPDPP